MQTKTFSRRVGVRRYRERETKRRKRGERFSKILREKRESGGGVSIPGVLEIDAR